MRGSRSFALLAILGACGTPGLSSSKVASQVNQDMNQGQPGYELSMQAIGCWFGGLWAEAEGYLPAQRRAVTEVRCREVLRRAFGDGQDKYKGMRDLDAAVVDELAQKAASLAGPTGGDSVMRLLKAVADAERESLEARNAAVRVRRDLNDPKELTSLDPEEVQLLRELHDSEALDRLLKADFGALSDDARVLGLLVAVDRVETVRQVPVHLRPHAVEPTSKLLFGIDLPPEVESLREPLKKSAAVQLLCDVARAAGYAVPDGMQHPMGRNLLAFSGILKALAERIRQAEATLSKDAAPTLRRIADSVARRLDEDYVEAQRAAAAHRPPARPPGG